MAWAVLGTLHWLQGAHQFGMIWQGQTSWTGPCDFGNDRSLRRSAVFKGIGHPVLQLSPTLTGGCDWHTCFRLLCRRLEVPLGPLQSTRRLTAFRFCKLEEIGKWEALSLFPQRYQRLQTVHLVVLRPQHSACWNKLKYVEMLPEESPCGSQRLRAPTGSPQSDFLQRQAALEDYWAELSREGADRFMAWYGLSFTLGWLSAVWCAYQPFDTICIYLYRFVSFDGVLIDLAFRCLVCSACVVWSLVHCFQGQMAYMREACGKCCQIDGRYRTADSEWSFLKDWLVWIPTWASFFLRSWNLGKRELTGLNTHLSIFLFEIMKSR